MLSLYIDTAIRDQAEPLLRSRQVVGLTTNPTILERGAVDPRELPALYRWASEAGAAEVFFQTHGEDEAAMLSTALRLREIGEKTVIKVPATRAGFIVAAELRERGIPVLVTAVYNAAQAMLATAIGATYIAPYCGRMKDSGLPALAEITRMQRVVETAGSGTRLLVASLRSPEDIVNLAAIGVDAFAVPFPVFEALYEEPLTAQAVADFDAATERSAAAHA